MLCKIRAKDYFRGHFGLDYAFILLCKTNILISFATQEYSPEQNNSSEAKEKTLISFAKENRCSPRRWKAQTLLEYVTLIAIVVTVLLTVTPFLKRSIQSVVKVAADQLGVQSQGDQRIDQTSGYLVEVFTAARATGDKQLREAPGGITEYIYGDVTRMDSHSLLNMGFTNRRE